MEHLGTGLIYRQYRFYVSIMSVTCVKTIFMFNITKLSRKSCQFREKNVCVNKIDVTVKTQWLSDILIEIYYRLRYINCSSAHIRIGFEFETNFDDMLLYQLATFNQFLTCEYDFERQCVGSTYLYIVKYYNINEKILQNGTELVSIGYPVYA